MTISTSTPKSSGWPRISITRPTGLCPLREIQQLDVHHHADQFLHAGHLGRGHADAIHRRRPSAGISMPSGISIHCWMRSSCGTTYCPRRPMWNSPTTVGCARFSTLTISPSARPSGFDAGDPHHHAVAVHGPLGRVGRDEDVAGNPLDGPFGDQEAVAVAVHVQAADGEFAAARGHGDSGRSAARSGRRGPSDGPERPPDRRGLRLWPPIRAPVA